MFKIDQFSAAILDLDKMAREVPVDQYQHDALALIQKLVPFDAAWWGIMSPHAGDFVLHSSHLFELSASFVPLWEDTKYDDNVAKAVWKQPQRTVYFDERKLAAAPGLAELTGAHHIGQAFCTSHVLGTENTFTFLSLYRERNAARFTADERLLKQYLMPHLCSSWWANRAIQIERFKSTTEAEIALSLIDRQLEIVNIEAGFRELLQAECPGWSGTKLPGVVLDWLRSGTDSAKFSRIVMQRHVFADFWLISARERSRADSLSKREASIANAFSRGLSYKEIARELGSAPATVRHHLRGIYEKLGVQDKAMMISALRGRNLRRGLSLQ